MGVSGLPTEIATVHIHAGAPETRVKLAIAQLHLRKLSTAAGADLQTMLATRVLTQNIY